jgi:signal transduction histidine kinase
LKTYLQKIALLFLFVVSLLPYWSYAKSTTVTAPIIANDSIPLWIKASKNNNYSTIQQKAFLKKAYNEIKSNPTPTDLSSIAFRYYQLKDTLEFNRVNKEALNLSIKLKDSFNIADTHWNYATFYLNGEIYEKAYRHFTIAYNHFNGIEKEYEAARMLYSMAFIKGRYRDYTGSEVLTFEAIKKFKNLKSNRFLYQSYNRLGLLQNDIQEYDRALFYYQKALEYLEKLEEKNNFYTWSIANIGLTYLEKGDYKKAVEYFNKALVSNNEIDTYARIIDSKAYAKLMMDDTVNVKKYFFKSLKIKDSLNDKAGILITKIHLSDYYKYIKDTFNAIKYAKEANLLAHKIKNGRDYLRSLEQLADLDTQHSKKYLRRYIQYNDSLIAVERKIQNNFTRIDFETDEYIEETKRLSQQKIWITVTGIGSVLILSLLYFLRIQKSKTEKLLLETEQQKANEQVYLLTIQQQTILEEEKVKERNRISEELHDGVLGKLFGTRVGLGFLEISTDEKVKEQHQSFLEELQEIEKEIRDVSHQLNTSFESAEVNFTTIVEQLLKDKSSLGGFDYNFNVAKDVSWKMVNEIIKVNIYRIVQEVLQNIIKHANAQNVVVNFSKKNETLLLLIKDDGNGFKISKHSKGIGLKNIASRVKKLKGDVQFSSEKNEGTSIRINIPI